ncbi:MAG: hypothetical protein QM736_06775 [Vicinamibacterales bacterium]
MRLAFDLDGTVADMQSALAREARRLFPGIDPAFLPRSASPDDDSQRADEPSPQTDSRLSIEHLSPRQQRELWKTVCDQENWWETLTEIEPGRSHGCTGS